MPAKASVPSDRDPITASEIITIWYVNCSPKRRPLRGASDELRHGRCARRIPQRAHILVKPLNDERLGPGYMRVTTALPEDNARFIAALRELL